MSNFLLSTTSNWPTFRCAYQLVKPELDSIPLEQLIRVDVDIPVVVQAVMGKMARIRVLRSAVASSLADFDMRCFDRLDRYLRSLHYVHWLYQSTRVSSDRLREWLDEWPTVHEQLVAEASRLLRANVLNRSSFDACCDACKPCVKLAGAQRLCCLFDLNWSKIESSTNLRWEELAHAEVLAELASIAHRHGGEPARIEEILSLNRQRAFTLFSNNYDQVRRAAQFVRWNHGDADDIAPPLARQSPRRRLDSCPPISSRVPIAANTLGRRNIDSAS
jgi:hypothetical protein